MIHELLIPVVYDVMGGHFNSLRFLLS
jgi:hypothetical protein